MHCRTIFHVDMDAFFAAVEQRENPRLKGLPVIIGAEPGTRGVVSAASYEARRFGVHSAMPINEAYRLCPQGVFLRPRIELYSRISDVIMEILASFAPKLEKLSVDEAFLDMTGTVRLWGEPSVAAEKIAKAIEERVHLTASIGVGPNKYIAKIASDLNKPRGITCAPQDVDKLPQWLAPLPVNRIWGVGKKTGEVLATLGIKTIGDLQLLQRDFLFRKMGSQGHSLYMLARGIDNRDVVERESAKSISREYTFDKDESCFDLFATTLLHLARDVARRAKAASVAGRTVFITYRTPDFKRFTRQVTLTKGTNISREIFSKASILLERERSGIYSLRLLGVGITQLESVVQQQLFDSQNSSKAIEESEIAVEAINRQYGSRTVVTAKEMMLFKEIKRSPVSDGKNRSEKGRAGTSS